MDEETDNELSEKEVLEQLAKIKKEKVKNFMTEYSELCKKYGLTLTPETRMVVVSLPE